MYFLIVRLNISFFIMECSCGKTGAVEAALLLDIKLLREIKEETESSELSSRKERETIKLDSPEETAENESETTVVFHTLTVATNKIEIVSDDDVVECMGSLLKMATSEKNKYGTVEVRFATKEEAASMILRSDYVAHIQRQV